MFAMGIVNTKSSRLRLHTKHFRARNWPPRSNSRRTQITRQNIYVRSSWRLFLDKQLNAEFCFNRAQNVALKNLSKSGGVKSDKTSGALARAYVLLVKFIIRRTGQNTSKHQSSRRRRRRRRYSPPLLSASIAARLRRKRANAFAAAAEKLADRGARLSRPFAVCRRRSCAQTHSRAARARVEKCFCRLSLRRAPLPHHATAARARAFCLCLGVVAMVAPLELSGKNAPPPPYFLVLLLIERVG